jgi:outer membrane protein insertion porin family/translocation and assembly module TamA
VRRATGRAAILLLLLAASRARGQDLTCEAGDREVRRLRFEGNHAFSSTELARVVVTTPSSAVARLGVVGTRRCLDPDEFPRDVLRLLAYYRKRGYSEVQVDTVVRPVPAPVPNRRVVDVSFVVSEGRPVRVDSIAVTGLDSLRGPRGVRGREHETRTRLLRDFPLRRGSVFDRVALEAARDSIVQRLHNMGYPRAVALLPWEVDYPTLTAKASVDVMPGPFARVGAIRVRFDTAEGRGRRIPDAVVLRTAGLHPGDPVSADAIAAAQRALYQTDAYLRVEIRADSTSPPSPPPGARGRAPADTLVDLVVRLTEGDLRVARGGLGWATLDCFRTQGDFTDRYFAPWAQRLELSARVSRIGIGEPLNGAPDLCPQAKKDPYSDKLNYYLGATVRQSSIFRGRRVPSMTLFSSVVSEYKAFRRRTTIGTTLALASPSGVRFPNTLSYQFELGRTEASPVVFCAVFQACADSSIDRLTENSPLGALGYAIARIRLNDPLDPRAGSSQRISLRTSSFLTGSAPSQRFNKAVGDATWYWPLGTANVFLAHVQLGTVFGNAPPQERLYAGGPTTVRGYRQNELGPAVYIVSDYSTIVNPFTKDTNFIADPAAVRSPDQTIPAGGNRLMVGNVEFQLRSPVLPELVRFALFTDVGEVWNARVPVAEKNRPRFTPGAGIRVKTLFGNVRADLGYNPYPRPSGAAYAIATGPDGREALYCVSPGNGLKVTSVQTDPEGRPIGFQESGDCVGTFAPLNRRGILNRLNPSIWIGNAF